MARFAARWVLTISPNDADSQWAGNNGAPLAKSHCRRTGRRRAADHNHACSSAAAGSAASISPITGDGCCHGRGGAIFLAVAALALRPKVGKRSRRCLQGQPPVRVADRWIAATHAPPHHTRGCPYGQPRTGYCAGTVGCRRATRSLWRAPPPSCIDPRPTQLCCSPPVKSKPSVGHNSKSLMHRRFAGDSTRTPSKTIETCRGWSLIPPGVTPGRAGRSPIGAYSCGR